MYILLEVIPGATIEKNQLNIIKHVNGRLTALATLEEECRSYIQNEVGKLNEGSEIITVQNLNNIEMPLLDGIHMYRLGEDSDRVFLYKKTTNIVYGYLRNTIETSFKQIKYYQIIMYDGLQNIPTREEKHEMIKVKNGTPIPKAITIAPFKDMLEELKTSAVFLDRTKLKKAKNASAVEIIFSQSV